MESGKISEAELLSEQHVSLTSHMTQHEIDDLLSWPVELLAFCDEEGIRY